jgi:tetratricopeptide (TPR) repeat protein/tRNA A-37 threonylcarbamoyl transferase component Bud32
MNERLPISVGSSPEPASGPPGTQPAATVSFAGSTLNPNDVAKAPLADNAVGRTLGDYELLNKLGAGGMGVVYRARQSSANRIVALKVIRPERLAELAADTRTETLQRFLTEAQAAARLEHDHIVTVYDVGEADGQPFYSMRFVEGRSLAEMLRDGLLDNRRAAALMEPVARAVHHAHEQRILHRDLKPANVMVDAAGRPYVADFGLAKLTESASDVTRTGQVMGTPQYMSPEQAQDASRCTAASDVYSLGATLYDLLTGRPPFRAATPIETLRQVIESEPVSPRQLNPAIDPDLETIALKCLAKEPAKRYATSAALADDLGRYLRDEPIVARPVSAPERLWRWAWRHPGAASAVAAMLLTAIVLAGSVALVSAKNQALGQANQALVNKNVELAAANIAEAAATTEAKAKRAEAVEAAKVAQEQSQLALESLQFVIADIQRNLVNVPGAGDLRRSLLQTAIERLEQVSDQFASRGAIDRNTHVALNDLGDVLLRIGAEGFQPVPSGKDGLETRPTEAGPLTAARKAYERAFDIAQQLAAADPTNVQAQRDLSISYSKRGDVQRQSGQVTEALASYQKRLEISQHLAATDPSDAGAQRDLAFSWERMADVSVQVGKLTEAKEYLQRKLGIDQRLVELDPGNSEFQRDLSISYQMLGNVQHQSGQVSEARASYQKSLEIRQDLAAADPSDARAERDLSLSYERLGEVQFQSRQLTEALAWYQKFLEISEKLAAADPSDALAQRNLSNAYNKLGEVQRASGQLTEALASCQKFLEISQKLASADPSDAQAQRDLSAAFSMLGDVQLQSGQLTEALASYQKFLEIIQKLAATDPSDARAQRDLSVSFSKLGDAQLKSRLVTEALGSYQKVLEISQKLAAVDPSDAGAQRDLFISYNMLGKVQRQSGQMTEALASYQKSLEICQRLAADPSDTGAQSDLLVTYDDLGDVQFQAGQVTEAFASYQKCLEICQNLAANPRDGQAQLALYFSLLKMGAAHQEAKQFGKAVTWYRQALEVLERLEKAKELTPTQKGQIAAVQLRIQECQLAGVALGEWQKLLEQPAAVLPALLQMRGTESLKAGRVAEAVQAVAKLRELGTAKANQLYNAACVYSLCAAAIKPEKDADALTAEQSAARQQHIADALATLREAIAAGFKDLAHMQKDPDLAPLRDLPEFKALIPQ